MKLSPNRPKPTLLLEARLPCIWSGLLLSAALLIGPVSAGAQEDKSASASPATAPAKTRVMTPFGPMDFTSSAPASAAEPAPAEQQPLPPKKPPFPVSAQQPQAPRPQQQPAEPAKPAPPRAAAEKLRQATRTASNAKPGSPGTAQSAGSAGSPVVTAAQSSADQATPSKPGPVPPGKQWVSTPFGPMLLDKKKQ
jgi:fused signal recognition particle receptor